MIQIRVKDEMFAYDMYHICKAFCPEQHIEQVVSQNEDSPVQICIQMGADTCVVVDEEIIGFATRKEKKQYVNLKTYDWLSRVTGKQLAWGTLTGVRPTKLMMSLKESGMSDTEVSGYMKEHYRVTDQKITLGLSVAKREKEILEQLDYENGYSLYVGIPFCPSICSYCSFSSYPLSLWEDKVEQYLDALCKELSFVASVSREKKLNTIYIGGGTPTTLSAKQLERLLSHIEEQFDDTELKEFTVEAGRPDSITREKLEVIKNHKVTRISINPQTMQQKTLDIIGRRHTVEDIRKVYDMARELGFDNINMDLIAGLPGETVADMQDTLEKIAKLKPDSLTVHALAMKRASKLSQEKKEIQRTNEEEAKLAEELEQMIAISAEFAKQMDLEAYYLYRQKNIAGNFENVGYAKVDKAGIYNILIMEEKQSIVAVGAGASTKIVLLEDQIFTDEKTGNQKKIARVENVKDVEQYIHRIDEMIERKGEWLWR